MNSVEREIMRLQNNLQAIRKVAGWTTQELGDMIGVTKQTISNIENKKTTMTKTQYIALRTVIDYEIFSNEDNTTLAQIVQVLLKPDDEETNTEKEQHQTKATKVVDSRMITAGTVASAAFEIVAANPALIAMTAEWMKKIIKKK